MRVFNRILATIISLALIIGSAAGIAYLVSLLAGIPALGQLVRSFFNFLAQLNAGQIQAILLGTLIVALVLLVLEVRPWRAQFITIREDEQGKTQISRSDVETYLVQRLAREKTITPQALDVVVHGYKFDVATGVAVSTEADRQEVRSRVEQDIRSNLTSIGLDEGLERVDTRVARVKRAA